MTILQDGESAEIAVIIVNYGTAELAIAAVESVLSHSHGGRSVEVHLVDNDSPGDDAVQLAQAAETGDWGTRVHLHLETENHGFGRGNNVALQVLAARATPPGKVFLLNPDARLENEALDILAGVLDDNPGLGSVGARISKPGDEPVTAAFRFPSLASEFSQSLNFGPVSRLLGRWSVSLGADQPSGPVDWVAGAAVMFRFQALSEVGFFDPDYFLYYEEVDLMWRLAQADWPCWYSTEAHVVHVEGAATEVRSGEQARKRRPAYWYESRRLYGLKTWGRGRATLTGAAVLTGASLNHVLSVLTRRQPRLPLNFLPDYWKGVFQPLLTGTASAR